MPEPESGLAGSPGEGHPAVLRLALTDFRNYESLRLSFDQRPVVLFGANGAGKTNLLEAISFLAPGRGMRRARLSEVSRRGGKPGAPWGVNAQLSGRREIGTGIEAGSERRIVHVDGAPARTQAALAELIGLVWLTPAMDRLFVEGAAGRRRFLDRLVLGLDPTYGGPASAYDHSLRERARLLAEGRTDPAWLGVLEGRMAEAGIAVAAARGQTVARLAEACRNGIGPFPAAKLSLAGEVDLWLAEGVAEDEARQRLQNALARSRSHDRESGGALHGPHRSDLVVFHAGKDLPAAQCSTGEQKAVLISILLAQARLRRALVGQAPVLLLDEIAAHLDEERREALYDELCALPAQSWLSGTDEALFAPLRKRAQFFRVGDGGAASI